jgi:DNA processing protein
VRDATVALTDDYLCSLGLSLIPGIGWKLINRLLAQFVTPAGICATRADQLISVPGIGKTLATRITSLNPEHVRRDYQMWLDRGMRVMLWDDPAYPARLSTLEDRPLALFVSGSLIPADNRSVAIVGTREATAVGRQVATQWAAELAGRGYTVISGLARGIDSHAHRSALDAGGRTIAVLGSGLSHIYPPEHFTLAGHIVQRGALLSEVRPETRPTPSSLVFRNRLITALSVATIVAECGPTSGAMIAARRAFAQRRPVFVADNSDGPRLLLTEGAQMLPADADTLVEWLSRVHAD